MKIALISGVFMILLVGCGTTKKLMKNCEASQDKQFWVCEEP